ncbi:MAG: energy transducer TonB [Saprospirales bacterium]|nr:MAG: energy transducer TonB [Saprospirales bacterium]
MKWMSKSGKNSLDELLFSTKNREYGAYVHRKDYRKNLIFSCFIGISIMSLLYAAPLLIHWIKGDERVTTEVIPVTLTPTAELMAPPPILPEEPPKVEPREEPPKVATRRFVRPEVRPDEEVIEEDLAPTIDELKEAAPSIVTQEGVSDIYEDYVIPEPEPEPDPEPEPEPQPAKVFTFVEQWPEFPGGERALYEFLAQNIVYPAVARSNNIEGTVVIQFVVREDGSIEDPKVVRGIGGGCDEEALRVVKQMPNWIPGEQQGLPVAVKYNIPIRFILRN